LDRPSNAIERFFQAVEQETANGEMAALAERFSETFMAAGPGGAKIAERSIFTQSMPARKQMFDKLGCKGTRIASLEATPLDARYTLAKARWQLTFEREELAREEVFADSTYIVDTGEAEFRIILYLTSQDLPTVLKERGILPG
jgi:hypothetical protein